MSHSYDLTSGSTRYHIRRMAIPAAVGLLGSTIYNLTDTFYAGFISVQAQSALTLTFPLYLILLASCLGLGETITARFSNALGQKKRGRAVHYFGQGLCFAVLLTAMTWCFLIPITDDAINLMGTSIQTRQWAIDYSVILYWGCPFFLLSFLFDATLQSIGNTKAFRNSVIVTVLLNFILDPIFIFGWFGIPPLGVQGIAIATVIAQFIGTGYLFVKLKQSLILRRWRWRFSIPYKPLLAKIILQSLTPMGRMIGIGIFFFIVVTFLGHLDENAVAAYGIALRIEQMILLPAIGLEIAMLAFAGQNLSAGNIEKTKEAHRLCLFYGFVCMGTGSVLFILLGEQLIGLFNNNADVIGHGKTYLIVAALVGPLYVLNFVSGSVLMGGLRVKDIAITSLLRLLVIPVTLFSLLTLVLDWGVTGIWIGIAASHVAPSIWLHYRCKQFLMSESLAKSKL